MTKKKKDDRNPVNESDEIAEMERRLAEARTKANKGETPDDIGARVKTLQEKHAKSNKLAKVFSTEENIAHEKINGTIERQYKDRREIIHLERLFQDRVEGVVGLRIRDIIITSKEFVLFCSDEKNKRAMRIYLTHSQYGNTLRLTATEIVFRVPGTKKKWERWIREAKADGDEEKMRFAKENLKQEEQGEPREYGPMFDERKEAKLEHKKRVKAIQQDREMDKLVRDTKLEQIRMERRNSKKTNIH